MPAPSTVIRACLAALLLASPMSLSAQAGPRLGHEQVGLRRPVAIEAMVRERPDLRLPRQTQWVKGGIIGGVILGGATFLLAAAMVGYGASDEPTIVDYLEPTLLGAATGFMIGALIGGQFEKN
jgi:hypothetical protein